MDIDFLSKTPLFAGIAPQDIPTMLPCLGAYTKTYPKGSALFLTGDHLDVVGLVLQGSIRLESCDVWGNQNILDHIAPGQVFGEAYSCLPQQPLLVDILAGEESQVLFLQTSKVLHLCPQSCPFHQALLSNLLSVMAQKNLKLNHKIRHTTPKTIRARLLSYLSQQATEQGSHSFTIPFDRQQLADYLCVDRSALSHELGKMQKEGLLTFSRSQFQLFSPQD